MTAVSAPPAPEPASTSTTPASTRRRISLPTDRYARWLLVITLAALVLRVLFVLVSQRDYDIGQGDSFYYHRGAELLVDGHGFVAPHQWDEGIEMQAASHPPVYILYLAAFTAVGLGTVLQHMLASCLLGAGAVALVGLIGRRFAGDRVGLIAAGIAAVYPQMWINDGMLMSESAAVFFGLAAILAIYRFHERRTHRRAAVMGFAIAVAALSRSELILLAPLVAVPMCLAGRGDAWRPRLEKLVVAGLGALVLIGPWVAYNLSRFEHPVYLSAGLEITQAVSNCDDTYSGEFIGYWSYDCQVPIDDAATARGLDRYEESVRSRYMGEAAREYIGDHLGEVPGVVAARIGRIAGVYRPTQQLAFDSFTEGRPRWAAQLAAWGYWTLAPLAVAGAVIARRRGHLLYPLLAVIATVVFAVVITFAGTRYRAPAEPVLALLAAVFLDRVFPRRAAPVPASNGDGADAERADARARARSVTHTATPPSGAAIGGGAPRPSADQATDPVTKHQRFPNFDGLRTIAAVAVLVSHVSIATGASLPDRNDNPFREMLPRFDAGVAVFFVISGFLLFRPFARALLERRSGPGVRAYALRRALRIYPLYWVVLAVVILANHIQDLDPIRFGDLPSVGELLAYASLLHIYHPDTAIAPIGQAWTLGTEISFYVFLPLFGALLHAWLRRVDNERRRMVLIGWSLVGLAAVATASKLWVALATSPDNMTTRGMYTTWLPYNLDLFAAGMALGLASVWWRQRPDRVPAWTRSPRLPGICWTGAAVAFWVVSTQLDLRPDHLIYTDSQLVTRQTLYLVVGVLLVAPAVLGPQDQGLIRRFLSSPVMVGLGLASYGIYLWHQLVGAEYYELLGHQIFDTAFWPALLCIFVASCAAALLTYRVIEEPLLRWKNRRWQDR